MLTTDNNILLAKNPTTTLPLLVKMANRHGLVTGATGTGKTVTLQSLAESFSALGVPVVATDIKGDLAGLAVSGGNNAKITSRVEQLELTQSGFNYAAAPVCLWDIFCENGHPLRTTISDMGPLLISRLLDLNPTQSGVLQIIFRIADENGLLLLDLKDLRKIVEYINDNRKIFAPTYGNMAPATLGAIQRGLLQLETGGGELFFGEPALNIHDLLRQQMGKGIINLIASEKLLQNPRIYAAFLLWLLSELFENMPEVGDLPLPKLVIFFDEAHLLFKDAPKVLLEKIEQVVRLIRSKGIGVYFVTQNPADIPESVLAQLGNRVQHALRAYTPSEQKAVRAAAKAFRPNPAFKTEDVITALEVGEALVSCLDNKGAPQVVERAFIIPPQSQVGALDAAERSQIIKQSLLYGRYDTVVDRESAYEILTQKIMSQAETAALEADKNKKPEPGLLGGLFGDFAKKTSQSVTRNIANQVGRSIVRGLLGGIFGSK